MLSPTPHYTRSSSFSLTRSAVSGIISFSTWWFWSRSIFKAVILNTKNQVLKVQNVYVGSLNTAVVRVGELFREAIRVNAAAIIVAHNHPSGDPTPSAEDVHVTRQMVEAGKLLNIDVLDHLVICQARWVSLKERGLGFLKAGCHVQCNSGIERVPA